MSGIDEVLARIGSQLKLDGETEHEILAEIRSHLEEAVAQARAEGLDEAEALSRAAARFGAEEQVGKDLQATHAGWGTADAVLAAALPVVCALVLRWLAFAPDGTAVGWQQVLSRPAFWGVALAGLLLPVVKFRRWRYAVAGWAVLWALTVLFAVSPALRW
ncbi:MAG TPA: permease prefix domain 1-containing protein [Anaerolineae bacterium]|nr:permease prefix domain 1-containing protein [Anaerolineae bacterium]